jgi:hypothetical protein
MPRKPSPPPDDPEQSKRFIDAARAAGTDDDPEAFERVFEKVVRRKPATPSTARGAKKPPKSPSSNRS